jgi:hypothetical protein
MKSAKISQRSEDIRIGLAKSLYRMSVSHVRTQVNIALFPEYITMVIAQTDAIRSNAL